jgi:hypothetical protein
MPEVVELRDPVVHPTTPSERAAAPLARNDVTVFRAALAAVALAVADDAFIHPEPGVTAGNHLASGLVPLVGAALLIAIAPRLCAVVRAWLAIFAGALAITGGATDGVRHIAVDRVSGDDATAVLAGVAGIVLVALGVATLWRTRRTTGSLGRRLGRRTLGGVAIIALTVLVVLPTGIAIVATHKARARVAAASLGRVYRQVQLNTSDGLRLRAWYVPSRNRAAVIAFPGRSQPVPHARMLVRHGYGVLLLDRRGEGASDGDYNAFGWSGERDLLAAIAFLRRQRDVDPARIGGLGLSVGGELLLQTAAHTRALRAVVSEGAGQRSLAEHLDNPEVGRVQRWVTGMLAQTAAVAVLSNSRPPDGLADLTARVAPRPVLLIEALNGNPDEILNDVYADRGGPSTELWKVAAGGHTGALAATPARYEERVVRFLDRALLAEE